MSNERRTIGFVRLPPTEVANFNLLGRDKFELWPQEIAILDSITASGHKVQVIREGGFKYVNKALFQDKKVYLTILSTGEEEIIVSDHIKREITSQQLGNPSINIDIEARVKFRLITAQGVLEKGLDNLLQRNATKLVTLENDLQTTVREAVFTALRGTHLKLLGQAKHLIGAQIKKVLDLNREISNYVIEITRVLVDMLTVSSLPVQPEHEAGFIYYRGPIDLYPDVVLHGNDLKLLVKRDRMLVVQGTDLKPLRPNDYPMNHEPLDDPHREVILVSTSITRYEMTVNANHNFSPPGDMPFEQEVSACLLVEYQISPTKLDRITYDTANGLMERVEQELVEVCRRLLREVPTAALYAVNQIVAFLKAYLVRQQPLEEKLNVRIDNIFVKSIDNLPPNLPQYASTDQAKNLLPARITTCVVDNLFDPNGRMLQVPVNCVALIYAGGEQILLEAGDHPYNDLKRQYGILPTQMVKKVRIDEVTLPVSTTINVSLPMGGELLQLPITINANFKHHIEVTDPTDRQTIRAIANLPVDDEQFNENLRADINDAIADSSGSQNKVLKALVLKMYKEFKEEVEARMARSLSRNGVNGEMLIQDSTLAPEFFAESEARRQQRVRLIEKSTEAREMILLSDADAVAKSRVAQIAPPVDLRTMDAQGQKEFLQNMFSVLGEVASRTGSGEELSRTAQDILGLFGMGGALPAGTTASPSSSGAPRGGAGGLSPLGNLYDELKSQFPMDQLNLPSDGEIVPVWQTKQPQENLESESYAGPIIDSTLHEPVNHVDQGVLVTPPPTSTASTPAQEEPNLLAEHKKACETLGARFKPAQYGWMEILISFPAGGPVQRIRLILKGLEDYPYSEPVVDCCVQMCKGMPDREIEPNLSTLNSWPPGATLMNMVKEIMDRQGQLE